MSTDDSAHREPFTQSITEQPTSKSLSPKLIFGSFSILPKNSNRLKAEMHGMDQSEYGFYARIPLLAMVGSNVLFIMS
jgi:hypothetical protein